jgi:hypothetical protein
LALASLSPADAAMIEKLAPKKCVGLSYTLDRGKYWRIMVDIECEGPVRVDFYEGIGAFREETAGEGGVPYATADGRRFTVYTTDFAPGGYWFIAIRNMSKFDEVVIFDSFAVETAVVEGYVPPKTRTLEEMKVGWDGKPSPPLAVRRSAEEIASGAKSAPPKHDLYAAMMARLNKKS